mmetsp:Transcript_10654/g.65679  ORF Transcript_10654/g.65679 Transcript_10654/m.65679 type:complete len:677 (+) Transcript_10654:2832-4862(+)
MAASTIACAPCTGLNSCLATCRDRDMVALVDDASGAWLVQLRSDGEAAPKPRRVSWEGGESATCARWSPDDRFLVLVTRRKLMAMQWKDQDVRWMDAMPLHFHARDVDVCMADDGPSNTYVVAVAGADGVQWFLLQENEDGTSCRWKANATLHSGYLMCKNRFSKDGKHIAVACVDGHVALWKVNGIHPKPNMELVYLTVIPHDRITALEFSDCGSMLAIGCWEGQVVLLKQNGTCTDGTCKPTWEELGACKNLSSHTHILSGPTLLVWSQSGSMLAVSDGRSNVHFFTLQYDKGLRFLSQERIWKGEAEEDVDKKEGRTGMAKRVVDRKCVVSVKGFERGSGLASRLYCYGHSRNICTLLWPTPPPGTLSATVLRFGCGILGLDDQGKTVSIACGWNKRLGGSPQLSIDDLKVTSISFEMKSRKELDIDACRKNDHNLEIEAIEELFSSISNKHDFLLTSRALLVRRGLSLYVKWRDEVSGSWQGILAAVEVEHFAESGGIVCTTDATHGIRFWLGREKRCIRQIHPDISYAVRGCLGDDWHGNALHHEKCTKSETMGLFALLVETSEGYQILMHMIRQGDEHRDTMAYPITCPPSCLLKPHLIDFFDGLICVGLTVASGRTDWLVVVDICTGLHQEFPVQDESAAISCLCSSRIVSDFKQHRESSVRIPTRLCK